MPRTSVGILVLILGSLLGCASRNIHPELSPDFQGSSVGKGESLVTRGWTYSFEPLSSARGGSGVEYIAPLAYDRTLIVGSSRFGVVSFYPHLQRERWRLPLHHGVISPMTEYQGVLYFVSGDGEVLAVSADQGKILWRYVLRNPVASKITVKNGLLYLVTSDDTVVCLSAQDGVWKWHYRKRSGVSGPTIHGASTPFVVDDTLWVGFSDGSLVVLNPEDGKIIREKQLNTNRRFSDVNADFVRAGDSVLVPTFDGALYALNPKDSSILWVNEDMGGASRVSVQGEFLYVASSSGKLFKLSLSRGTKVWEFELDQGTGLSPRVVGSKLVVASTSRYFYVLNAETGKPEYRYDAGYASGFAGDLVLLEASVVPSQISHSSVSIVGMTLGGNLMNFNILRE